MKLQRLVWSLAFCGALACCSVSRLVSAPPAAQVAAAQVAAPDITVKVVAFNDFHGNLLSPGSLAPAAGKTAVVVGGIDYLAAYVAWQTSLNANHVVVSAGDLTGASQLVSAAYHDEGTIEAMNLLGLDFNAVGNHEFDAGVPELARKQSGGCLAETDYTCLENHAFSGASFKYLAANIVNATTGRTLFPAYEIKTFEGVRIAFVGVALKETPDIVSPSGTAGLVFEDEADTVNALVPELRARGVTSIVVLLHQGGFQKAASGDAPPSINSCAGLLGSVANSPILGVVARLDDAVDVVVSAHTHTAYNCRLPNSVGRAIAVAQASAFGRVITDYDLTLNRQSGRVTGVSVANILVSQPEADSAASPVQPFLSSPRVVQIRRLVADYRLAVAPVAGATIGSIAARLPSASAASGEQPAGDLIADSQLAATAPANAGAAVVSFVNATGVRNPGFDTPGASYPHEVTYQEAFNVRPFGDSLVTVTLTAQGIRDLLEQQFAGCHGQTNDSFLQVSNGFTFEWSAAAPPCAKIRNITLIGAANAGRPEYLVRDGIVQQPAKPYRVCVDSFLAAGKGGFGVLLQGTEQVGGPQDVDSVVSFLSRYKAPNRPYDLADPALHVPRIVRLP